MYRFKTIQSFAVFLSFVLCACSGNSENKGAAEQIDTSKEIKNKVSSPPKVNAPAETIEFKLPAGLDTLKAKKK